MKVFPFMFSTETSLSKNRLKENIPRDARVSGNFISRMFSQSSNAPSSMATTFPRSRCCNDSHLLNDDPATSSIPSGMTIELVPDPMA